MSMKHSVALDQKRCRGCTSCIKSCPTEAIRVRGRMATILPDRCIDCGTCIRICPHRAIRSSGDSLDSLKRFKCCVALPEPALYGQFQHLDNVDVVLAGLLKIGFHRVYEVARAAEILSDYERKSLKQGPPAVTPQISSACPAVLRLIRMRFPKLMEHVSNAVMPMELAAILARREAEAETGLSPEEIGVFAIVPCSSKVTAARESEGLSRPVLDGAFSIKDVYLRLLGPMREVEEDPPALSSAGIIGLGWGASGGECAARLGGRSVAVDGIVNVIRMLEEIEDGRLPEADFLELSACTQGCVGGCFTVENPYGAKMRLKSLMKGLPVSRNRFTLEGEDRTLVERNKPLQYLPTFVLDHDREAAFDKQRRIQELEAQLPGLHCGSCGAPSCRAFAEDVVLGRASMDDCIFKVRERMRSMAGGKEEADDYLPPPFRRRQPENQNS